MSGHGTSDAKTHRLASVSAAAALRKASAASNLISTGSNQIDSLLAGGLTRGKVIEAYGPPGSGKTTLGITAAANALQRGGRVAWVDCAYDVPLTRLKEVFESGQLSRPGALDQANPASTLDIPSSWSSALSCFYRYRTPTLAHLAALITRPPASFPPESTTLLVIDAISTPFNVAFPSNAEAPAGHAPQHQHQQQTQTQGISGAHNPRQWAASRRWATQREVVSGLQRIAGVYDCAVLVTSQMATRIDREMAGPRARAVLRPSLGTRAWTDGIWARMVLVRHWGPKTVTTPGANLKGKGVGQARREQRGEDKAGEAVEGSVTRFAGLVKLGSAEYDRFGRVVMFAIGEKGFTDSSLASMGDGVRAPPILRIRSSPPTAAVPAKRGASEIADSESDDDDEAAALNEPEQDPEVEELDDLGLTREEQALLELELERSMQGQDDEP